MIMIDIDDKRPPKDIPPADPWTDWKPVWRGKKDTPHTVQERHSPTEPVTMRLGPAREAEQGRRRITDAKLWDSMTTAQQDAAVHIATAFEMTGRGLGYVTSNWRRIPGCRGASNVAEAHARMIRHYMEWARACAVAGLSHSLVIDVLCFGFSCRMIDRDRRLKNGATRDNLLRGLALYAVLRGWEKKDYDHYRT